MRQMTLDLHLRQDATLENYYAEENNQAMMIHLHTIASGRGERLIYLWGPSGVGCTHLLQGCCHTADRLGLSTLYLSLKNIEALAPEIFEGLENLNLICIDDIQGIVGDPDWEEAFFHCFNRMIDAKKRLIIAGNAMPKTIGILLPDLASRLTSGIVCQIYELTEESKIKALIKRADKQGFNLPLAVARFLFYRVDRDLGTLFEILKKLDEASLEAKHKLTIPFVKDVLGV